MVHIQLPFPTRRKVEKLVGKATFDCPACERKQTCSHIQIRDQEFIYHFLPFGNFNVIDEFLVCGKCQGRYPFEQYLLKEDRQFYALKTWDCPSCHKTNPNNAYKCKWCKYSLL